MRGAAASGILAVWKRAAPRNWMREILTSGSVGGLAEQSLALPGRYVRSPRKMGTRRVSEGCNEHVYFPRLRVGLPKSATSKSASEWISWLPALSLASAFELVYMGEVLVLRQRLLWKRKCQQSISSGQTKRTGEMIDLSQLLPVLHNRRGLFDDEVREVRRVKGHESQAEAFD